MFLKLTNMLLVCGLSSLYATDLKENDPPRGYHSPISSHQVKNITNDFFDNSDEEKLRERLQAFWNCRKSAYLAFERLGVFENNISNMREAKKVAMEIWGSLAAEYREPGVKPKIYEKKALHAFHVCDIEYDQNHNTKTKEEIYSFLVLFRYAERIINL